MNRLFEAFESLLIGPEKGKDQESVLQVGDFTLDCKAMTEGILTLGSIGRGKSTLLRTLLRGMLRHDFGGLIPTVKPSMLSDAIECIRKEGRCRDLVLLEASGAHVFNPFESSTSPSEAAALMKGVVDALSPKQMDHQDGDFWQRQLEIILRHLFALSRFRLQRLDLAYVTVLFEAKANSTAEALDPAWASRSEMAATLKLAEQSTDQEVREAARYFQITYLNHGDRLQGSLAATVSGVLDHFQREPLKSLFSGKSTFSMEDLFERGKVCIVGLPVLSSDAGRIANAVMQFCFCREAVKRRREHYSFLVLDEGQELMTTDLMRKMALIRESKVAVLFLTQNLAVVEERTGSTTREAFFGLLATRIFLQQNHAGTREWASQQIDKTFLNSESSTRSKDDEGNTSGTSVSRSSTLEYRVQPIRFSCLETGESIVLRDSDFCYVDWHYSTPGKNGTARIL
jgi:type IV secretory pathway TraG/TraD family ATPase VirD4